MECKFKHYLLLTVMVCCMFRIYALFDAISIFFLSPLGTNIFLGWTLLFSFLPILLFLLCFTFPFVLFYFALFLLSHSFARLDILRSFDFVSLPLTTIQQQIISYLYNKKVRKVLQKQTESLQCFLFCKRAR